MIANDFIFASSFILVDTYSDKSAISGMRDIYNDESSRAEDPRNSWVPVSDKSRKDCQKQSDGPGYSIVRCSNVSVHFYRNF